MRLGITGHRGLPDDLAAEIRNSLYTALAPYPPTELVGVSCIADGPDAWFARAVLDLGGTIEVVIPAETYRAGLPRWHHPEYDSLLAAAHVVHRTGMRESTEEAHMAGSEVLLGVVEQLIAVWDGAPARGYGGTADVVAHARRAGVPVHIIWPEGATR
ncbi:hypothetical protein SAMN06297387_1149 [Streptomyces zhaozhouensis]|uniref:DUF2493 domain-containing protein n=1 Tax=Streptomyces zhaozhouensis TaxID=1300267 RepID=A0A286DZI7_9ACTN|nr:hypothetical protein [Streptomyces zhaozhouensis]SOD64030.1 hypothetical protein SAMN06297387_1149 [Streptomyces zhaozhouensis]